MPSVCGGFFTVKRYRFKDIFSQKIAVKNSILPSSPVLMGQKKIIPVWILQREVKDWEALDSPGDTEYIQRCFEEEFEFRGWD